jgi:hypothetical protein
MAMLEHYTSRGLILAEDVTHPIEYYIRQLADHRGQVLGYLRKYRLTGTLTFLGRYSFVEGDGPNA